MLNELAYAPTPGEQGARVAAQALGGIGREVPAVVDAAVAKLRDGSPEEARAAWVVLRTAGPGARRATPVLIERLERAADPAEADLTLQLIAATDGAALESPRVRAAALPRVRAAASAALGRGDAGEAAVQLAWLRQLGAPAGEVVPLVVRAMADAERRRGGGGWGGLAGMELVRPYGRAAAPVLNRLTRDPDAMTRAAAAALFATPGVAGDGDRERLKELARADPDTRVRTEANAALDAMGAKGGGKRGQGGQKGSGVDSK